MTTFEIAGLAAAAAAAGAINSVAGGGTLITFPALIFFGMRPEAANATSTLALVAGTAGSLFGYRRHAGQIREWLGRFAVVSVVGGLLGAVLLTKTSDELFSSMVPFLILFATVLFVAQDTFRRFGGQKQGRGKSAGLGVWGAIIFQFAVSVYGGYFGAGIGILMLASLGFLGLSNIHEMNALKTVLAALINVVATFWFIWAGLIFWPQAVVMTAGALAGYYAGAHFSQRIPQARVKQVISGIGFAISGIMFYKQFVR